MKLSVVLPTFNEAKNILQLIEQINKAINPFEIIVVDDNSPDQTWKIVQDAGIYNVSVLLRTKEKGLPSAIWSGILNAKGDIVAWMDCDLCHPPALLPELVARLQDADIAIASRYAKNGKDSRKLSRVITSYIFNLYARIILQSSVKDLTSGYIAAKKRVFNQIKISPTYYGEYFIKLMNDAQKNSFKIVEVPYLFTDRKEGESKTGESLSALLKHGYRYGISVLKIKFS